MDGLTESSIEDFIISTIVAPFDSIMSKDLERSATPTSFSVRDWASDIEISGIFILITSIFLIEYSRKLTVLENTVFPKSPLFLFTSTFQGDFYIFSENFQIPIDKPASLCGRDY